MSQDKIPFWRTSGLRHMVFNRMTDLEGGKEHTFVGSVKMQTALDDVQCVHFAREGVPSPAKWPRERPIVRRQKKQTDNGLRRRTPREREIDINKAAIGMPRERDRLFFSLQRSQALWFCTRRFLFVFAWKEVAAGLVRMSSSDESDMRERVKMPKQLWRFVSDVCLVSVTASRRDCRPCLAG